MSFLEWFALGVWGYGLAACIYMLADMIRTRRRNEKEFFQMDQGAERRKWGHGSRPSARHRPVR